jgi:hypothetical protein
MAARGDDGRDDYGGERGGRREAPRDDARDDAREPWHSDEHEAAPRRRLPPRRADDPPEGWEPRRRRANEIGRAERVARKIGPYGALWSTAAAVFAGLAFTWVALGGQTVLPNDRMQQVERNGIALKSAVDSIRETSRDLRKLDAKVDSLTTIVGQVARITHALARLRCYEEDLITLSRSGLNCREIIPDFDAVREQLDRIRESRRGPASFYVPPFPSPWTAPLTAIRFTP